MAVEILRPNATGDYTNIASQYPDSTEHWDKVDEAVADDDDTYIQSGAVSYEKDAYNLTPSSIPAGSTINSVKVFHRRRSTVLGQSAYSQVFVRLGTDETAGSQHNPAVDTYCDYLEELSRPSGGVWSVADLADLQVAIGLKAPFGGYYCRCTQVYAEVDYTLLSAYYHGLKVQGVGELALCNVGTHPLRFRKGGVTYGIELVPIGDPNASPIRIKTGAGIKAIRKYT